MGRGPDACLRDPTGVQPPVWTCRKFSGKKISFPLVDRVDARAPSFGLTQPCPRISVRLTVFLNPDPEGPVRRPGTGKSCCAKGRANPSPPRASCEFKTWGIYGLDILDPEMSLQGSERPETISMTIFFRSQGSCGKAPTPHPHPTRTCFWSSPHASLGAKLCCPQRLSHFHQNKTKQNAGRETQAQLPAALTAPTSLPGSSTTSHLGVPEGPWLWFSLERSLPFCRALASFGNVGVLRVSPCRVEARSAVTCERVS